MLILIALAAPPAVVQAQVIDEATPILDDQPLAADAALGALLADLAAATDSASLLAPDLRATSEDPSRHRGKAFHLSTGPATRVAERAFDITGLSAWQFASPDIDEPILLLIHEPQGTIAPGDRVSDIAIAARFYKTAIAQIRRFGADRAIGFDEAGAAAGQRILIFVGGSPVYSPLASDAWRAWSGAVLAIIGSLGALLLVRVMLVRRRAIAKPQAAISAEPEQWNDANLPPEPAEALAELRRRAGDTMTHER